MYEFLMNLLGEAILDSGFEFAASAGVVIALGLLTAFPIMYLCDIVASVVKRLFRIKD